VKFFGHYAVAETV